MENIKESIFYVPWFWAKFSKAYSNFFGDATLIAAALIPWLLVFVLGYLFVSLWLIAITQNWMMDHNVQWLYAIWTFIYYILNALIVMIGSIVLIICIKEKEQWNQVLVWELFEKALKKLPVYIKVVIKALLYVLKPLLVVLAWVLLMAFASFITPVLVIVWLIVLIVWIAYMVRNVFDIIMIYNISIVENKDATSSLNESIQLMKWNKWNYVWNVLLFAIISYIFVWILVAILHVSQSSVIWLLISAVLDSFVTWMLALMTYMLYRQYSVEKQWNQQTQPQTQTL